MGVPNGSKPKTGRLTMSIVSFELPESIAKEFSVDEKGHGFVSRRGTARLSGVHESSIRKLLKLIEGAGQNTPKNLKPFAGLSFDSADHIPDVLASAIIKYYSRQGKEVAQDTDDALGAVGLRTIIQSTLGWEPPRRLTEREIVEIMCLPVPTDWQPRFSVEFYDQLSRLTGLQPIGHKRPLLWARLTKEMVYDYMPKGVYEEIKAWQSATDPNKKLHQYLSEQGIELLGEQLKKVITLMTCAGSLSEVVAFLEQSKTRKYQLSLFSGKLK
jgi:hypothetical protein